MSARKRTSAEPVRIIQRGRHVFEERTLVGYANDSNRIQYLGILRVRLTDPRRAAIQKKVNIPSMRARWLCELIFIQSSKIKQGKHRRRLRGKVGNEETKISLPDRATLVGCIMADDVEIAKGHWQSAGI